MAISTLYWTTSPKIMTLSLNIQKSKAALSLQLQKAGFVTPPVVDLTVVMDVSASFEDEHQDGITTDLMARLIPWGMTFDPDKKLDVITFSNGANHVSRTPPITADNYIDYVKNHIIDKVPGWNGGTDYSYAIEESLRDSGWLDNGQKKAGFLGRLFGAKDTPAREKKRSLVVFITDGDNTDKQRTRDVLRASEERQDGVYFLFIGVANGGGYFHFLDAIGEEFGNTGFVRISNLSEFVQKDDEDLNKVLLDTELMDWLKH